MKRPILRSMLAAQNPLPYAVVTTQQQNGNIELDDSLVPGFVSALVAMTLGYDTPSKKGAIKSLVVANLATWCG